ncbi:ABC transporter ATP-binding protein [Planococcus halocryophilus Or1]|uniref:ABC transporter n=1 Tax=Planococcus halocryophilus TaxID=1215089 RepID=A0A1C7DV18_9BACL|nr:ABC transporter ATP-binding protein [Planococcus halocryophilus]ANU15305.1 ABC transporter [Planococcus halocryophilus]EMF47662.1 ABC transporter ATP-binding protein [Planococcus halocryophilus Or1]
MATEGKLSNVTLKFRKSEALKDISLTFEPGKIYGLIGRNGAGKTVLLSLLAAFREPTTGQVEIDGEPVFENADKMQQVSFIYTKNYEEEYENIPLILKFSERYRPNFDKDYAHRLLKRFKLPLDKPINKLSKGMQAALNVVIGLASRTPLTIFDEVYLGMDAPTRVIFYEELLADQAEYPRTFILSTHLVSEMDYLFDHVVIIHEGRLLLDNDYETISTQGVSITGAVDRVDAFVSGRKILNEQKLGDTKSVMTYGALSEEDRLSAQDQGLAVGPLSLQDLFIHLTEEAH